MLTPNDKRAIRWIRAAEFGETVFKLACWAVAIWLLAGCATASDSWGCRRMRQDQAVREACMSAAPSCQLTAEQMRQHAQTAEALKRYCQAEKP